MKSLKLLSVVIVACLILITGCQKDSRTENRISATTSLEALNKTLAKQPAQLSPELIAKFEKIRSSLPAGLKERMNQKTASLIKTHPEFRDIALRALKVIEPTPCDANTPLNNWLGQQLSDWNNEVIYYAVATGMLFIPEDYASIFENSSANQYFGVNGEYTHILTKTFKDLKRFWNIQSSNIALVGMHGSTLRDRDKLIAVYHLYGLSDADAEFFADFVLELLKVYPQYRNGDHPIFTFNSFASPSFSLPPYGQIPAKIIMGDGIMEAYTAIGYGDVAPQAIIAHEFGHHIQFQLHLFENVSSPEATRRTELMADAYSAYYLSHARGASMQWKRVKQFLQVFFNIGDCSFSSNGHHGTPTQRMAAAEWAYHLADNAQKQGHILTAQQFTALFEAALPNIVSQ